MPGKRNNYISFDTYFMMMALMVRERSKDPKTQVGAVIVRDNRILGTGYNGTSKGITDDEMPWDSLGEANNDLMNIKNSFVVHAEANALDSIENKSSLKGSTMYITLSPCPECAKRIANSGIKNIIYFAPYKKEELVVVSNYILKKAGVKVEQYAGEAIWDVLERCQKKVYEEESLIRKLIPKN